MSDYYLQFLEAIDEGEYQVSDWEAEFLENMLKHRPQQMSPKQQDIIRRMAATYLGEEIR